MPFQQEAIARQPDSQDAEDIVKTQLKSLANTLTHTKILHDKMLDKLGPVSHRHRCFPLPFDQKLAKKKKFKKAKKKKKEKKKSSEEGDKIFDVVPLFDTVDRHSLLRDNFLLMCRAELTRRNADGTEKEEEDDSEYDFPSSLRRPPSVDAPLRCYLHHRSLPHLRLSPYKLEESSRSPFIAVVHDFLSDREMSHLRAFAAERLFRSNTGLTDDRKVSLVRTSKQTWMEERFFHFKMHLLQSQTQKDYKESREPPPTPFEPWRYVQRKNEVGFAVAERIEELADLNLLGPFSSEQYQVRDSTRLTIMQRKQ